VKKLLSGIDLRISMIYLLFSGVWIFYSDRLVNILAPDLHTVTEFQTMKGWGFVLISSFLIYYLLHRYTTKERLTNSQLQSNEEKFTILFMKAAFAASLSSAKDGRLIEINDKFEEVFGFSRVEAIGKTTAELGINPDEKTRSEIFKKLGETGFIHNIRMELFSKSGVQHTLFVNIDLIEIGGEKFILNTTQDVTAQEKVLEELQNSEQNLKKAQHFAQLGSWTWTIPTNKLEWSDEMYVIFGISKESFTGNLADVITSSIHPDDRERVEASNASVVNEKTPIPLVYRLVMPDQSTKTVWAEAGEMILDKQGNPYKLSGIVQDITDRILSEEKIHMQADALEAAANAIVITEISGKIVWANSAFTQLTGYSEEEYLGKELSLLNSGKQSIGFYTKLWQTILSGEVWRSEIINRDKNGHLYHEEETITPIRDEVGKITHFIAIKQNISDRIQAENRIHNLLNESEKRLKRLQTLRDIDNQISSNYVLGNTLEIVLQKVKEHLEVDGVAVLLYNEQSRTFVYGDSLGLSTNRIRNSRVKLGESLAGRAAYQGRIVHITDVQNEIDPFFKSLLDEENFVDYYGIPLLAKGKIIGVMEVYNKTPLFPDDEWMEYYQTLAGQTGLAVENAQLIEGLQKTNNELINSYDATIEGWSRALDLRDKETEGHTQRVSDLTITLAKHFGFSDEQMVHLRRGALLHDIGKMGIPDSILTKPGILTEDERKIIENHPQYAYNMLENIDFLQPALEIPHLHHEKWDGTGYPYGLKGKEIPLSARMFAVIDVFDALTSDRPYRSAWSKDKAIEYLKAQSGRHFDPAVVVEFLKYLGA